MFVITNVFLMSDPSSNISLSRTLSQPRYEVGRIIVSISLIRIIRLNKAVCLVNVKH